jgi:UDP-glucose-4-epimerase GalE
MLSSKKFMNIFLTGGAGYIGSHTAWAVAKAGHKPVVFDNLLTGHRHNVKWGPLVEGELADADLVARTLRDHSIDAVIHFAARIAVGESVVNPRLYYTNNVAGTLSLLGAMLDANVKTIVFSSTAAIYGDPVEVPIPEDHPHQPVNPYGESKLFVEHALRSYGEAYGLKWVALRYFNASGAVLETGLREEHDPETHLIPLIIQAALGTRPSVSIFGTDYPTPDGTAVRDYIHVADLAQAHQRALEYLGSGGKSGAFNLGTGTGWSVRQVIEEVRKVSGRDFQVREAPRRAGDPPELVADSRLAQKTLGWTPQFSDLPTIVKNAWDSLDPRNV